MVNVADITITSLDTIKGYTMAGDLHFILDELQDATIANTEDSQDITGKGGRLLNSLKRNKACTISGTNGLLSAGLLSAQTGSEFEVLTSTAVSWTDYLVVTDNAATTQYKAVGTTGAEITAVYVRDASGAAGKKLTQGADAGEGTFAYDPQTKALTFSGIANGTEIIVDYMRNIAGSKLTNESDIYSQKLQLYVDGTGEDKCGNVYRVQFYIPRADFNGNFDIQMGGDQTVHAFEAKSLAGSCGVGGMLWTYTVFGVNAEDVA